MAAGPFQECRRRTLREDRRGGCATSDNQRDVKEKIERIQKGVNTNGYASGSGSASSVGAPKAPEDSSQTSLTTFGFKVEPRAQSGEDNGTSKFAKTGSHDGSLQPMQAEVIHKPVPEDGRDQKQVF